ncbi:MAG: choline-sulfatase [Paracoccaceae bacterium]|nr:choline-sulfatase [Paracoccaceae bacterium]
MTAPNILFIMCDQLTAIALRSYGNKVCRTPSLDALAREAAVFENAYCPYPLCAPSRFAMMTGRLPSRVGAYDNGAEFPASTPTIAHYLRDAGYYTCISGKMHFLGPDQLHGFEDRLTAEIYPSSFAWTPKKTFDDLADNPDKCDGSPHLGVSSVETVADAGPVARSLQLDYDDEVAHRARQHIFDWKRSGDTRPLFMMVSFTQPHDPYVVSQPYWDIHSTEEIDKPRVAEIPQDELDPHSVELRKHYSLDHFEVTEEIYRRARCGYYGMIAYVDEKVGMLRRTLDEAGIADNTVIVFASDHGDMIGERGLWFKKTLFDPAVRVPILLYRPNGTGRRITAPVSLIDLLPTLVDLVHDNTDRIVTDIEGRSLLPLLKQDDPTRLTWAEHLDGAVTAPRIMVRKGRWKLVYSKDYPPQFYDLQSDPGETTNLADDDATRGAYADCIAILQETWDLDAMRADVIRNQQARHLVHRALSQGKSFDWEMEPNAPSLMSFVRGDDVFPNVERRRYLHYSD